MDLTKHMGKDFIDDYRADFSYHFYNGYSRFLAENYGTIQ